MNIEIIKNKKGEVLTTKKGEQLKKITLEVGDEFIPEFNEVMKREHNDIINYTIRANVRDKNGVIYKDVYLTLTKSQAEKLESSEEPNQKLWRTYNYDNNYGTDWVGITCRNKKEHKKPKTFEDFDNKIKND